MINAGLVLTAKVIRILLGGNGPVCNAFYLHTKLMLLFVGTVPGVTMFLSRGKQSR